MSDKFSDAFKSAIESARRAEAAKEEVKQVFCELNDSLSSISNGKVKLSIENKTRSKRGSLAPLIQAASLGLNPLDDFETYEALVIKSVNSSKESKSIEVARWRQSENGYPCSIIYKSKDIGCTDKESLINMLNEFISSTHVGKAILEVMNTH